MIPISMLTPLVLAAALGVAAGPGEPDGKKPASPEVRTLVIYDVRDLVSDAKDAESPNGPTLEQLVAFLRDTVALDSAIELKAQPSSGSLVAVATAAEHERLNEALTTFRTSSTSVYRIDLRIVQGAPEREGSARVLDEPLDAVIERLKAKGGANVLVAPRILTHPLQKAMLSVLDTVPFVKGYSLVDGLDGIDGPLVVPEIARFEDGVVIEVLVSPIAGDGEPRVRVDLSARVARIERPIPVEAGEHGPVHKPVTTTREVKTSVTVPLGKAVALSTGGASAPSGGEPAADDDAIVVFLEVAPGE